MPTAMALPYRELRVTECTEFGPPLASSIPSAIVLTVDRGWVGRSPVEGASAPETGGKSEHHRAAGWLTARRGDPTTSATENKSADGLRKRDQVMRETVG